jgi:hypothetical protein
MREGSFSLQKHEKCAKLHELVRDREGSLRTVQRPRRHVGTLGILVLRPFFRYSYGRDAYVLRIVGDRVGPVLRLERRAERRRRRAAGRIKAA